MEKVTVIIPVYNSEKFLPRCLNSIIKQKYTNLEIICIDDGSNDNSLKIIKFYQKIDKRIKYYTKENQGVSSSRNLGIKKSSGSYICFLDSDDWVEEDMIYQLVKAIEKNKVDVVRCNYYINYDYKINYNTGNLFELKNKLVNDRVNINKCIELCISDILLSYVHCIIIKRECLMKLNKFNEDIFFMEDKLFYIDMLSKVDSIYFLDKTLYHYFINFESATRSPGKIYKNIQNVVSLDSILKKLVIENQIKINEDVIEKANLVTIITLLSKYVNSLSKDMYKQVSDIFNNQEVKSMFNNDNYNVYMRLDVKILLRLIKAKKILLFMMFSYSLNILKEFRYSFIKLRVYHYMLKQKKGGK
ncbi:MAG: glycosyltransferase [Tissierellia bacterium]|nr:glycosyltransferase [Tissierellia bacterium]